MANEMRRSFIGYSFRADENRFSRICTGHADANIDGGPDEILNFLLMPGRVSRLYWSQFKRDPQTVQSHARLSDLANSIRANHAHLIFQWRLDMRGCEGRLRVGREARKVFRICLRIRRPWILLQRELSNPIRPASGVRIESPHPYASCGMFVGTKTATDQNEFLAHLFITLKAYFHFGCERRPWWVFVL